MYPDLRAIELFLRWEIIFAMAGSILTSFGSPGRVAPQKGSQMSEQDLVPHDRSLTTCMLVFLDIFAIKLFSFSSLI